MKVIKASERDLFLRLHLGEGSVGEEDFSFALNVNGKALIFSFPEGDYLVQTADIVREVAKFRQKTLVRR